MPGQVCSSLCVSLQLGRAAACWHFVFAWPWVAHSCPHCPSHPANAEWQELAWAKTEQAAVVAAAAAEAVGRKLRDQIGPYVSNFKQMEGYRPHLLPSPSYSPTSPSYTPTSPSHSPSGGHSPFSAPGGMADVNEYEEDELADYEEQEEEETVAAAPPPGAAPGARAGAAYSPASYDRNVMMMSSGSEMCFGNPGALAASSLSDRSRLTGLICGICQVAVG